MAAAVDPRSDSLRLAARVKKVGNSLAFFIPAADARKAGIVEGDTVDVRIRRDVPRPLGLLKGLPYQPFSRSREGLWRDRL